MINAKKTPPIMKGDDYMSKYVVCVTETLEREVEIEADNDLDALFKVRELYDDEKIVLDADDITDRKFTLVEDKILN